MNSSRITCQLMTLQLLWSLAYDWSVHHKRHRLWPDLQFPPPTKLCIRVLGLMRKSHIIGFGLWLLSSKVGERMNALFVVGCLAAASVCERSGGQDRSLCFQSYLARPFCRLFIRLQLLLPFRYATVWHRLTFSLPSPTSSELPQGCQYWPWIAQESSQS